MAGRLLRCSEETGAKRGKAEEKESYWLSTGLRRHGRPTAPLLRGIRSEKEESGGKKRVVRNLSFTEGQLLAKQTFFRGGKRVLRNLSFTEGGQLLLPWVCVFGLFVKLQS
jgi:hypothetical protein